MYGLVLVYLKRVSQSLIFSFPSYLFNLTNLSNDAVKKAKLSLNWQAPNEKVMNFSLFCAIASILLFWFSSMFSSFAFAMIKCAS